MKPWSEHNKKQAQEAFEKVLEKLAESDQDNPRNTGNFFPDNSQKHPQKNPDKPLPPFHPEPLWFFLLRTTVTAICIIFLLAAVLFFIS